YHSAGRMASAVQLFEESSAGYVHVLGADHPDTLASRVNLAHTYYAVGRLTDGLEVLRDAAARCERVLPPGDPLTRPVREGLANIEEGNNGWAGRRARLRDDEPADRTGHGLAGGVAALRYLALGCPGFPPDLEERRLEAVAGDEREHYAEEEGADHRQLLVG